MSRKKHWQRLATPPVSHDPALLEAVQAALVALAATEKEATPSAVEGWIKANRHDVWLSIKTAGALQGAIQAARQQATGPVSAPAEEVLRPERKRKPRRPKKSPPPQPEPDAGRVQGVRDADTIVNGHGPSAQRPPRASAGAAGGKQRRGGRGKRVIANKPATASRSESKRDGATNKAQAERRQTDVPGYDPTRSEMLHVLTIAREQGGVAKLRKLVQVVKQLADQAGGLDRLAACLDALEEFGIK